MIPGKKEHEFVDPPMEDEGSTSGSFVKMCEAAHKNMVEYLVYSCSRNSMSFLSIVGVFIFFTTILMISPVIDSTTDVIQKLVLLNMLLTCLLGFVLMLYRVDFRFIVSVVGIPIVYITKKLYLLWVKYGSRKE
jgi:hypothetical protein